jgi:hypothetical protein
VFVRKLLPKLIHQIDPRIKTNTTGAEFLYLPLEVEVSSQPGIYCPQGPILQNSISAENFSDDFILKIFWTDFHPKSNFIIMENNLGF